MLRMKPYSPSTRIAVRDSIEEDLSDDIDDDVFIRDGKAVSAEKRAESNGIFQFSRFQFNCSLARKRD